MQNAYCNTYAGCVKHIVGPHVARLPRVENSKKLCASFHTSSLYVLRYASSLLSIAEFGRSC